MTTIDELHRGELARHVADLTHDLFAAEQREKDAEARAKRLADALVAIGEIASRVCEP